MANGNEIFDVNSFYRNIVSTKKLQYTHLFLININIDEQNNFGAYSYVPIQLLASDIEIPSIEVEQNVADINTNVGKSTFTGKNSVVQDKNVVNISFLNLQENSIHETYFKGWIKQTAFNFWGNSQTIFPKSTIYIDFLDSENRETVTKTYTLFRAFPTRIDLLKPDHKQVTTNFYRNVSFKFSYMNVKQKL